MLRAGNGQYRDTLELRAHGWHDGRMAKRGKVPEELPEWDEMLRIATRAAGGKKLDPKSDLPNYVAFAKRLRSLRDEHDLSLGELGKMARVERSAILRIEQGQRPHMSVHSFFSLCVALSVHPLWMWFGDARFKTTWVPPPSQWRDVGGRPTGDPAPVSGTVSRAGRKAV